MAERRMFAKSIIDSDAFLEMPMSTQLLYFHLCMRADDDGFLNNSKRIQRMIGATDDDFRLLLAKKFIIPFDSGVIVIKHWRIHNYIQKDRYKSTNYIEEKRMLGIKANKAYTLLSDNSDCVPLVSAGSNALLVQGNVDCDAECEEDTSDGNNVYEIDTMYTSDTMDTQVRLGKDSIEDIEDKEKEDKEKEAEIAFLNSMGQPKPTKKKTAKREETLMDVLDSYGFPDNLRETILDFIDMRKKKKHPLTPRALRLVIKRLTEMCSDNEIRVKIVEQSIIHSWDTVYELKNDRNGSKWDSMSVNDSSNTAWAGVGSL